MKKLIALLFLIPIFIIAETEINDELENDKIINEAIYQTGENYTLEKEVEGNAFITGNTILYKNIINGISFVVSSELNYDAFSEYVFIAAFEGNFTNIIEKDAFIAVETFTSDENFTINRDLYMIASNATISGQYKRNILLTGQKIILDNVIIKGDIKLSATNIEIKDNVTIEGTLTYNEDANIIISENATINETITSKVLIEEQPLSEQIYSQVINLGSSLIVFLGLYFILPKKFFTKTSEYYQNQTIVKCLTMFGTGAISLIGIPMLSIILMSLIFGITLSILILTLYVTFLCLSLIMFSYIIGNLMLIKLLKKENNILLSGLIGIITLKVLCLIPILNVVALLFGILIGFGTIIYIIKVGE